MPFGGLLSLGTAAISAGGAIGGMFGGGGAGSVQAPNMYNYRNTAAADDAAYYGAGNLNQYNVPAQLLPQYQQIAQQAVSNPYAPGFQQSANAVGAQGMGVGQQQIGQGLGMLPDVNALLSLGFDPQNAMYSKLSQQNADQSNASLASRGLGTTPYGAGLFDQSNQNFNLNWQDRQLGRAAQGAGAAGGLLGQANQSIGTGLQNMTTGSSLPYNTFQGINANALNTLGQTGQFGQSAAQLPQQQIQDYLAYLGNATGQQNANNAVFGNQLAQNNMGFNQNQTLGSNLGSSLAGLGKAWGGVSNPWGGSFGGQTGNIGGTGLAGFGGVY